MPKRKVPTDFREALRLYGKMGRWSDVAEHYGCTTQSIKNALSIFLSDNEYVSSAQAIYFEFVESGWKTNE